MGALGIAVEDPDQPEIRALLEAADRYYAGLYDPDQNHLLDVASLREPGLAFFVVRDGARLLGFGAIAARGNDEHNIVWGEVKRMYVAPEARGRRIGRMILERLVAHAQGLGIVVLRLETGDKQPEALGLYRSSGFRDRGPFADYEENGSSIFMEMRL